jgi:ectoine hydroxylase-related dioxygenase (phytanoyl-CoA dioxygenase family)
MPPQHFVRPEPGKLVLFPSYMWHGTVPFTTPESRLTVAFDLLPGE